eukprot:scaffold12037_cov159-Ochromonas_danica.AAC.13
MEIKSKAICQSFQQSLSRVPLHTRSINQIIIEQDLSLNAQANLGVDVHDAGKEGLLLLTTVLAWLAYSFTVKSCSVRCFNWHADSDQD